MRCAPLVSVLLLGACAGNRPAPTELIGAVSEEEFRKMHELRQDGPPPLLGTMVEAGGMRCYLSLPPGRKAPLPAILVIHEWWGLNGHVKHWCDRLAADGYAALGVDLYGGKTATTPEAASALMQAVVEPAAIESLRGAHRFLAEDPRIHATKRGVIGWCFGGRYALLTGLEVRPLQAVVMYYGMPIVDPKRLQYLRTPLFGVFADQDASITPKIVDEFERGLRLGHCHFQIRRYDAVHAFANPSNPKYDEVAAGDAWRLVSGFFAMHLR